MIQVEQTPNPDSLKFLSQKILSKVGTEEFKKSNLNNIKIPFVKELLNFSGVELHEGANHMPPPARRFWIADHRATLSFFSQGGALTEQSECSASKEELSEESFAVAGI